MIRYLKYYAFIRIFTKAKFYLLLFLFSLVGIVFVSFLFADLIEVASRADKALMVLLKWFFIFVLLCVAFFALFKMTRVIGLSEEKKKPKEKKPKEKKQKSAPKSASEDLKERIIKKERLVSKKEQIFKKYKK